jgi:molybdate transport system substrate-binding protein
VTRLGLVVLALLPVVIGCGGGDDDDAGSITVLAASSLTAAFGDIADAFDGGHVELSFAASSALVEQANAGAPGDVIVTADEATYGKVRDVGKPTIIARNRLAILVPHGNPEGIERLDDLSRDGVVFILCAPEAPCGALGAEALRDAGVTTEPVSLEENAKGVVSKVALGEADAGLAYVTDVTDDVDAIPFDGAPETAYAAGVLGQSDDADVARAFVDFVASDPAQAILREHGFSAP